MRVLPGRVTGSCFLVYRRTGPCLHVLLPFDRVKNQDFINPD